MNIRTNHQWRQFKYRYEVPASVLAREFDYLTEDDSDGYFQYRGIWYHTSQFMRCGAMIPGQWDGFQGDSFFSGVLIRLSSDGESYQVATYHTTRETRTFNSERG